MPELPEVEILKRDMQKKLSGHRFVRTHILRHDLRYHVPANLQDLLYNKVCDHFERRGKFILGYLKPHGVLIIHLGMSGQILLGDCVRAKTHEHVIFEMDNGVQWSYRDVRRFGFISYEEDTQISNSKFFCEMGIEPLSKEFTGDYLFKLTRERHVEIKNFLLNQHEIAGIGNIYACEALYRSQISPFLQAGDMRVSESKNLVKAIKTVLFDAIQAGGSSIKDCVHLDGTSGKFQKQHHVYGRKGLACSTYDNIPCSVKNCCGIKSVKQSGRTTFFCPTKQRKR